MIAKERPAHALRRGQVLALAGLAFSLAACAGQPRMLGTMAPPPPAPALSPPPAPPLMVPPPPPVAASPAPTPMPTDAASLQAAYGAPDFVRREANSELWRYDAGACAVFFFLYRDGSALRIRYVETEPRGAMMAADPQCLASLNGRVRPTS
jgi:hypothetical protein